MPNPQIKREEVFVEIHAAALNRADLMQRESDYPPPPGCPDWMGLEIAGVIVEMGDEAKTKSNWKIGDNVCALLGGGGYAEYAAVKYDMLMPVPNNCSIFISDFIDISPFFLVFHDPVRVICHCIYSSKRSIT